MRSARLFLPLSISLFMKRVSVRLPNRGSGGTSRFTTRARRGMLESPFERSKRNEPCSSGTEDRRDGRDVRESTSWLSGLLPAVVSRFRYVSAYLSVRKPPHELLPPTGQEPWELSL